MEMCILLQESNEIVREPSMIGSTVIFLATQARTEPRARGPGGPLSSNSSPLTPNIARGNIEPRCDGSA
jgi:hypothetical protein